MASLTLRGLLLRAPTELPARGDFTTPMHLVGLLDEEAGDVFHLVASDEAAAALAGAETPCPVTVELRARQLDLASLTSGSTKGKAYRLRVVAAKVERKR